MSQKDYIVLAAAIKEALTKSNTYLDFDEKYAAQAAVKSIAHGIAAACADSNPRFNRNIFIAACGLGEGSGAK